MKKYIIKLTAVALLIAGADSCKQSDLNVNPNIAGESSTVPSSLILNRLTWGLYQGGGVVDLAANAVFEGPWDQVMRWNQFTVSNNSYYRGQNIYSFSNTATAYDVLKYVEKMEMQSATQFGTDQNIYAALGKFFRAYSFIWLTQRVGDIPMSEAGNTEILEPVYDTQKDVYKNSLQLLDDANTVLKSVITTANANTVVEGDIYGLTYKKWQKVINSYKLRVLISLSKRAADNTDLNIQQQFAAIINDPVSYPVFESNADNLEFKYNASYNPYPHGPNDAYNTFENIGNTYLDITTANLDPRTFITSTPAPAQITAGKTVSDFAAYTGADISAYSQAQLTNDMNAGKYSFVNFKRYFASLAGSENYIIAGYPELCFNVAEAINRGWLTGDAASWYNKGIDASLGFYGLTDGQTYTVGDKGGVTIGSVVINIAAFKAKATYKGNNADGLKQILEQKYVAFFQNSQWEAFYNWRRTGIPAFKEGGSGIGTPTSKIPRRWLYPVDEKNENTAKYNAAISSQYGGKDEITAEMWLLK
ncbi:SusD/RagB family nutrient-binding outer membrane lipoprotein [Dyadobacter sp. NIV53]|uniref:SusD/RagB family nutrient-binding outer membrane lipoprotein n=1 Tax=Dyadobacter sp. NIV53 TaxID=2861765 RepID=UPI001C879CEC|nr:SusD/RagB family nutrient-binding outer membrane lipoprotein [Dyadobacter sp. NIV53]